MAETKKYLDQAGLQLVLSKLTTKYDGRYLGLHATADAAQKTVHKLTINVRDEEARVFDGSQDFSISVAQAEHRHPASEIDFTHAGMSNVATVSEALDVLIKNVQIASGVLSSTTANMNTLKEALDQEVLDRAAADGNIQDQVDALKDIVDEKLDGSGNIFDILEEAKETLQEMIDTETKRAQGAEKALADRATAVEGRLDVIEGDENKEGSIKKAVNDEKTRAMAAEKTLTDNLAAEVSRAEAEEKRIDKKLDDEIARAKADEGALSERITANTTAIGVLNGDENTDGSVAKDIKDAEARVKVTTDKLDGRMTSAEAKLTVIQGTGEGSIKKAVADLVDGAPDTLDTLNELAAALRVDKDVLTAIETAFNAKLADEKKAREAKDKLQDEALAKEVEDRTNAVTAEEAARKAADSGLDARIQVIETKVKAEDMTLAEVKTALETNAAAIKTEKERAEAAEEGIQDQINIINGAVDVEGSFRKAIADQAATQSTKDQAQDKKIDDIKTEIGTKGASSADSTGMYQFIFQKVEAEAATRESEDSKLLGRIEDIEDLIGDEEGATLKELHDRLTTAESEIDQAQKDILKNAQDIAAIVALEEKDIDAAFAAVFNA